MAAADSGAPPPSAPPPPTGGLAACFNFSPPDEGLGEPAKVQAMKDELGAELTDAGLPEECVHDWKLVRFLRGHGDSVAKACKAWREMATHREEVGMAGLRTHMLQLAAAARARALSGAGIGTGAVARDRAESELGLELDLGVDPAAARPDPSLDLDSAADYLVWPYVMPEFAPLLEGPWEGVPPCVPHGFDALGNPVTITTFAGYRLNDILAAGLADMWIRMVLMCDVYWDVLVHVRSLRAGRLVARHDVVDIAGVGLSHLGRGALGLLKRMGESASKYPELICRTDVVNFGRVGLALWSVGAPFLPRQTREKLAPQGCVYTIEALGASALPRHFLGCCACGWCRRFVDHSFATLELRAGQVKTVRVAVTGADAAADVRARWEARCAAHDVRLTVSFEQQLQSHGGVFGWASGAGAGGTGGGEEGFEPCHEASETGGVLTAVVSPEQACGQELLTGECSCGAARGGAGAGRAGALVLNFSNEHSRFRSKTVQYRVMLPPLLPQPLVCPAARTDDADAGKSQNKTVDS